LAIESRLQPEHLVIGVGRRRAIAVAADYVALLKPRIVLLLVLTELGAMVTAARGWPHPGVLFGSLAGGALAAGGSGAINCWFDRDIDLVMPRTRRRPVPAGRVRPTPALVFGCVCVAAGVVLISWAANTSAGALALLGALVYVVVYTMWLKRSTTQNIVIGGAAGAIPPLVGWAAVTGSLSPLAWALFAVVFLWTPPHFWALALVLRRQYSAVGVPMLPSVVGPQRTNRAILGYTIAMLGASLLPAVWLGLPYAAAASMLGVIFLAFTVRAFVRPGGRSAYALFSYSLVYLALLFIASALSASLVAR
jgi:protoheme IX farnesyltransferase